jgi:hypothetical protein
MKIQVSFAPTIRQRLAIAHHFDQEGPASDSLVRQLFIHNIDGMAEQLLEPIVDEWRKSMKYDRIEIGHTVRSFDFEHRTDCYMEGIVEDIKDERYHIRGTRRVWMDAEESFDAYFTAPINGLQIAGRAPGDVTRGVVKL